MLKSKWNKGTRRKSLPEFTFLVLFFTFFYLFTGKGKVNTQVTEGVTAEGTQSANGDIVFELDNKGT